MQRLSVTSLQNYLRLSDSNITDVPYLPIHRLKIASATVVASLFGMTVTTMYFVKASVMNIIIFLHELDFNGLKNQCELFDLVQCTVVRELKSLIFPNVKIFSLGR